MRKCYSSCGCYHKCGTVHAIDNHDTRGLLIHLNQNFSYDGHSFSPSSSPFPLSFSSNFFLLLLLHLFACIAAQVYFFYCSVFFKRLHIICIYYPLLFSPSWLASFNYFPIRFLAGVMDSIRL